MCSIGEEDLADDGGIHSMIEEKLILELRDEICKKCNTDKVVVQLNFKEAQCYNCFLNYARHKFRATLGASKIVPKGSNVLVYVDGSDKNIVLLDMINYALNESAFKRLHFNVILIFIDDFILNKKTNLRMNRLVELKQILDQFSYQEIYYSSIANDKIEKIGNVKNFEGYNEFEFLNKFTSITNLTSKQDYVEILTKNLLQKHAHQLNCQFTFTSEISSDLAKTFLKNISLGRGGSVALDISFVDDRSPDVKHLRPIRDLNQNEINNYIKLKSLKFLNSNNLFGSDLGEFASLQNLTDSFVENLQNNYSSTVSTVYRTGDKIATSNDNNTAKCKFCKVNIDFSKSNTLFAIEYSRLISNDLNLRTDETVEEKVLSIVNGNGSDELSNAKKHLCHGCRNIFVEINDFSLLE